MNLWPFGKDYLPVHDDGEPTKRIGWVPTPERVGKRRFRVQHEKRGLLGEDYGKVIQPARFIETEAVWLNDPEDGERILAVKRNAHSIEDWRKVLGWIES